MLIVFCTHEKSYHRIDVFMIHIVINVLILLGKILMLKSTFVYGRLYICMRMVYDLGASLIHANMIDWTTYKYILSVSKLCYQSSEGSFDILYTSMHVCNFQTQNCQMKSHKCHGWQTHTIFYLHCLDFSHFSLFLLYWHNRQMKYVRK